MSDATTTGAVRRFTGAATQRLHRSPPGRIRWGRPCSTTGSPRTNVIPGGVSPPTRGSAATGHGRGRSSTRLVRRRVTARWTLRWSRFPKQFDEAPESTNRGMLATSRAIAIASLASRLTGFLRTSLLVAAIGTAEVGDAYNLGNNLPNMVYELLLGGVLSSVLIPLLVRAQEDDDDDGVAYTQRLLSIATAALAVMTFIAVLVRRCSRSGSSTSTPSDRWRAHSRPCYCRRSSSTAWAR